jgi:hypothetical protein
MKDLKDNEQLREAFELYIEQLALNSAAGFSKNTLSRCPHMPEKHYKQAWVDVAWMGFQAGADYADFRK